MKSFLEHVYVERSESGIRATLSVQRYFHFVHLAAVFRTINSYVYYFWIEDLRPKKVKIPRGFTLWVTFLVVYKPKWVRREEEGTR